MQSTNSVNQSFTNKINRNNIFIQLIITLTNYDKSSPAAKQKFRL